MKFAVYSLCFVAVLAFTFADSDAGHFIPKAFYTLDSDGHKSNLHAVSPHTAHYLRRLRRQVVSSSSSLSSSSVAGSDDVTHFTSQTLNSYIPDARRFGHSDDVLPTGHVVRTSGVIDKNGKVYYETHESDF